MIWFNFDTWNSRHGHFLSWKRIYKKDKWTPFCRVERRYDSWLGFWKKAEPTTWLLVGHTIIFAGIPSDEQMQEALDVAEPLGLIPTDQALASNGALELYLKDAEEPNWKISVPDGHGDTASVVYKGAPLKVVAANLRLRAGEAVFLTLEVWASDLEAVMGALDIEINIVPEE